jgi:hypothetical protein
LYEARRRFLPHYKIQIDYHVKQIPDSNEVEVLWSQQERIVPILWVYSQKGLKLNI